MPVLVTTAGRTHRRWKEIIAMRSTGFHSTRAAFTLIELVTVIMLLGIVGVFVGGPIMSTIGDMRTDAAAARLVNDVRYMQRMALGSGLRTWIVVDNAGDQYSLYIEDPNNPGKAGRVAIVHPLDQTSNSIQFGSGPFTGVTINSVNINSTSELEFDSFGVPYDANGSALASAGQIVLSSNVAIQVRPVGGYVEQLKWP